MTQMFAQNHFYAKRRSVKPIAMRLDNNRTTRLLKA